MNIKQDNHKPPIVTRKPQGIQYGGSPARRRWVIFLMLIFVSLGAVLGGLISVQVVLYIAGDINFINSLIHYEDVEKKYHKLGFVVLFIGGLVGAAIGGGLWGYMIRKTGFITNEELDRML